MKPTPKETIKIKQRHRGQPKYGRLLQTLNTAFNIMVFTDSEIYEVGRGGFGRCFLGVLCSQNESPLKYDINSSFKELMEDKNTVVVKVIPKNKDQLNQYAYSRQIDNLASIHKDMTKKQCQNVVRVYPFKLESEDNYYIVMEYCYNASLDELIQARRRRKQKFNFGQLLVIMKSLLDGYQLLKSKSIIHNDLKPHNIFIKNKIFKIGDFGISQKLGSRENIISSHGTRLYAAPQKIEGKRINHKADIYSLGLMFAQIMFGQHIYYDEKSFKDFCEYQHKKEQAQDILINFEDIRNPYEKIELLKQKRKKMEQKYFAQYLAFRMKQPITQKMAIVINPEDQEFATEIKQLVLDMCKKVDQRPTLQQIFDRLDKFPKSITNTILWYPHKFTDLLVMTDSQLNYQLENIPKERVSMVMRKNIASQLQNNNHYNLALFDKIEKLKVRVAQTTNFVKNLYLATTKLEPSNQKLKENILDLQLNLYIYIYWVNRTTLLQANQQLTQLSHLELNEVYRQCIEKMIRNMRIDDQFLGQLVLIDNKKYNRLNSYRQLVLNGLKFLLQIEKEDSSIVVDKLNYEMFFWLIIIFEYVKIQQKYSKEQIAQFGEANYYLSQKIQQIFDYEESNMHYEKLFRDWENQYHIFCEIDM